MTINLFHTISGLLILAFFISKVIIHYYIDHKNGESVGFLYSLVSPVKYFLPYKKTGNTATLKLQRMCNLLLILAMSSLVLNIFLGAWIYLKQM